MIKNSDGEVLDDDAIEAAIDKAIVEHDMKTIMHTCDRIMVLDFGVKVAQGTPEEVSADQRTIDAYLGKDGYRLAQSEEH